MLVDVNAGVFRDRLACDLALVGNGNLTEESFKNAQESAKSTLTEIVATFRPWEGQTQEQRKAKEADTLRAAFVAICGDPNDPEFRRKEAQAIANFEAEQKQQANANTVENRARRLLTERDQRRRGR